MSRAEQRWRQEGSTPSFRACAWRWATEAEESARSMAAPVRKAVALMEHGGVRGTAALTLEELGASRSHRLTDTLPDENGLRSGKLGPRRIAVIQILGPKLAPSAHLEKKFYTFYFQCLDLKILNSRFWKKM